MEKQASLQSFILSAGMIGFIIAAYKQIKWPLGKCFLSKALAQDGVNKELKSGPANLFKSKPKCKGVHLWLLYFTINTENHL